MREFPAAMTTASRRGRARAPWLVLAVAAVTAAPACKLNQHGVSPPLDRIAFPSSALVDPDGLWLYVANSNSDLRYNNGTLVAVDLDAAVRDRFGMADRELDGPPPLWPLCPGADRARVDTDASPCCWDVLDHQILNCDDRLYVQPDSTVQIGSFAAGMQFQRFAEPKCDPTLSPNDASMKVLQAATTRHDCQTRCPGDLVAGRLFIGVRGNSSLTYVDTGRVYDPSLGRPRPVFSCDAAADVCTVTSTMPNTSPTQDAVPPAIPVPDEPYALTLDEKQDLLYVGNLRGDTAHPTTGGISLFDVARPSADPSKSRPTFIRPTPSPFAADINGFFGITSLTLRPDSSIYATSRYQTNAVNLVPSFPEGLCGTPPSEINLPAGSDVYTTPLVGAEIRGIQFLPDPMGIPPAPTDPNAPAPAPQNTRVFVLQRVPPALVEFDMSTAPDAFGNFPSEVLETCAGPTFLQSYDAGEGARLYVTCFDQGQIYVFDPYTPRLIQIINAGRGPAGVAFPQAPRADRKERLAYIVGFSANNLSVLDLTPGSPTQYHVVQRIGFPTVQPR
jgi:DNA-binding beta-propeller fold protein YncE